MSYAFIMTHADRAKRKAQIKRELSAGETCAALAVRYSLTKRRILQIAQEAQLSPPRRGFPPLGLADKDMPHYRKLRRVMGVAFARAAFGIAA